MQGDYDNYYPSFINQFGTQTPELKIKDKLNSWKSGVFLTHTWSPITALDIISGLRFDYFQFNKNLLIAPRLAFTYRLGAKTSVNGAAGLYNQHLPMFFLSQDPDFNTLDDMTATHLILGFNHLISDDTRLSIEIYKKLYQHYPMDSNQPTLFILDENIYNQFYSYHEKLETTGEAKVQGVELLVQKKLSGQFYGLFSGTYYRAKYRDLNGVWRNRITDNKYLISTEIGYKPNPIWEFSLRWSYAGGIPYTPYDYQASIETGVGIYDNSKTMSERLPAYNSLNVRMDRRFYFKQTNLIIYLSIWNLLNHENISYHLWDENYDNAGNYTQWPRLPVFGIEFEL